MNSLGHEWSLSRVFDGSKGVTITLPTCLCSNCLLQIVSMHWLVAQETVLLLPVIIVPRLTKVVLGRPTQLNLLLPSVLWECNSQVQRLSRPLYLTNSFLVCTPHFRCHHCPDELLLCQSVSDSHCTHTYLLLSLLFASKWSTLNSAIRVICHKKLYFW